jgi:hypothetical protein
MDKEHLISAGTLNSVCMKIIKNATLSNGGKVSFVSFERMDGEHFIRIHIKRKLGGEDVRDIVRFKLTDGTTPTTMHVKDWDFILKQLESGSYEHKTTVQ